MQHHPPCFLHWISDLRACATMILEEIDREFATALVHPSTLRRVENDYVLSFRNSVARFHHLLRQNTTVIATNLQHRSSHSRDYTQDDRTPVENELRHPSHRPSAAYGVFTKWKRSTESLIPAHGTPLAVSWDAEDFLDCLGDTIVSEQLIPSSEQPGATASNFQVDGWYNVGNTAPSPTTITGRSNPNAWTAFHDIPLLVSSCSPLASIASRSLRQNFPSHPLFF